MTKAWSTLAVGPNPTSILGIPYQNAATGQETSYLINLPTNFTGLTQTYINTTPDVYVGISDKLTQDTFAGSLAIRSATSLQGGQASALWNIARSSRGSVDGIGGFRFLQFNETLTIESTVADKHLDETVFNQFLGLPFNGVPVINSYTSIVNK